MRGTKLAFLGVGLLAAVPGAQAAAPAGTDQAPAAQGAPASAPPGAPQPPRKVQRIVISPPVSPLLQQALDAIMAGDFKRAMSVAQLTMGQPPRRDDAAALEVVGLAQFLGGDVQGAIFSLGESVKLDPTRPSALTELGSIEMQAGMLPQARAHLEAAVARDPANRAAHEGLGALLAQTGDRTGAIEAYGMAVEGVDGYSPAKVDLGNLLNEARRFGDTMKLLQPVVTPDLADNRARLVLGTAQIGAGDAAAAMKVLQEARAREPDNPNIALALGIAARAAGQLDVSAASLEHAVALTKDWATDYYQLGLTYLAQSKYAEAQAMMEKAQAMSPDAATQRGLAESLLLGGKPDEAVVALRKLADQPNARLADVVALAAVYGALGRTADAEAAYREGVKRFPRDPTAYLRLGSALAVHRDYEAALGVLQQGLALAPEDQRLLRSVALVQSRLRRPLDAVATADKLVAASNGNPDALFLLGSLQEEAAMRREAIATYRRLLAARPDHAFALNNLASLLTATGEASEAVPLAQRAAALVPGSPNVQDTLGWALLQSGHPRDAIAPLQQASVLAPDNPVALYRLALAQKAAGDRAGARASLEKALADGREFRDRDAAQAMLRDLSR